MGKQGAIRKFFLVLSFIAFLSAGYEAANIITARPAEAQLCGCGICVYIFGGVAMNLQLIYTSILMPALMAAEAAITVWWTLAITGFTDEVVTKIEDVTYNFTNWVDVFWYYTLQPALQTMTDQLMTINSNQSMALGMAIDAANHNRVLRDTAEYDIQAHREQRPGENVCVAGTVTGGMTRVNNFRRAYNAAAPTEMAPRSGNRLGSSGAAGPFADLRVRWQNYTARYCRRDSNNGASGCAADAPFADQDVDVGGMIFAKDTIDLGTYDIKKSVDDLIVNIAEPFVKSPVPGAALSGPSGQAAILEGESYKAKRQVIYDSLYHVVSRRIPGSVDVGNGGKNFIEDMRPKDAAGVSLSSPNPSHNEVMQTLMNERFRSGKYALEQIDEPENNQREMVVQQALQLMQMSDQLDLMDRYSLVLAAQAAAEIRKAKGLATAVEGAPLK